MTFRSALLGLAAIGGLALSAGTAAAAMPNGLPAAGQVSSVDQVRWVCNAWGHCWWRPNYYYRPYGYYYGPPRPYYYGYGPRFYGGWHGGWHSRGWHRHW